MSRYKQTACPECNSSDAFTIYEDGAYCFSCQYSTKKVNIMNDLETVADNKDQLTLTDISELNSFAITSRGISKQVVDHFGIKMAVNPDGSGGSHFYPYTANGKVTVVAYKERKLPKNFIVHGNFNNIELFGQSVASGGKTLVITEGELDACAIAQSFLDKYNKIFPVVSIPSASGCKVILEQREWIRRFESVILFFDKDDAGQAAVQKVAKIIGADKVKVAQLTEKDPCEQLLKHGSASLLQAYWNAETWSPAGIVMGEKIWREYIERKNTESIPYPECLEGLNEKLKGIRHGEITLFTSGTGSGKSTVVKEIVLNLLAKTTDKVGLISLEESVGDTAEKFISMYLQNNNLHEEGVSEERQRHGFSSVFGTEKLVLLDHQGSVGDDSLIDKIEYMALMGCKYMVLDHITIAVSEGSEGLSGNEAIDKVMSDLLKIVKKHNIWLCLISHLRKAPGGGMSFEEGKLASIDDIKGSGSIKQISFDIVAFARNLVAENSIERNTIKFRVLKSRFTGLTGSAGSATYDNNTGRLTAVSQEFSSL
jgi:twinkle protein|tara:strand:+ start:5056 stop:6675 length:1620 start_codon:yes stop_codon:yes gene_type:complete